MRPWRCPSILVLAALLAAGHAHADADVSAGAFSARYDTDKKLGVGLMAGIPSAVSVKYLISPQVALDAGVGLYIAFRDRTGFHIHADVLWHPFVAVEGQSFDAPLYVGVGGRILVHDSADDMSSITRAGLRIPIGIAFDFDDVALDIFLETAFVFDFSVSEGGTGPVDINGLVGVRYYLF